ncbi:hypothetical protein Tco_0225966 [Tanacetum coccineum]
MSGSPTPSSDPVVESLSPSLTPFGDKGDIPFLEELLNDDPTPNLPPPLLVFEINETEKIKTLINDPPNPELKDLPPHLEYILMEDDFKSDVQHQRRVNPKIHEVTKAEVIKLLDDGLIYPISVSPWMDFLDTFKFPLIPKPRKRPPSPVLMEHLLNEGCLSVFALLLGHSKDIDAKQWEDTQLVLNGRSCHFHGQRGIGHRS